MFPTSLPASRIPSSMDAPPLRWGILGTGWIADQFVDALRCHTRQAITAVGSRQRETAQRAANRWGAGTAYGSYEDLVGAPDVDVVYVASPHNHHLPHALLAIEAGKHVLIEKPVGLDAAEARAIHAAALAAGVFCMEAMWTLFLPKFDIIGQLLAAGALGTVHTVLADQGEAFAADHRILRPDLAGGPLLDLGTYPATLATWVMGGVEEVSAVGTPAATGVVGQLAAVMRGADVTAAWHCSVLGDTPTTAMIAGTEACLEIGRHFYRPGPFTLWDASRTTALMFEEPRVDHQALHFEAAEVARRISMGEIGSPLRPFADTIATLEVMDRVRASVGFDFSAAVAERA